jgi:hypothetical protein
MNRIHFYTIASLLGLSLSSVPTHANVTGGTVSNLSATRNIAYTEPSTVTLRWSMIRTSSVADPGITVSSTSGRFTDTGGTITLGTVARTLSKSRPVSSTNNTFSFNESVRIPRDVLYRAYKQNIRQIVYERDFTDCPGADCSTLSLTSTYTLAGSSASTFGISDFRLRMDDGSLAAVVQQSQKLHAVASINVTGTGTIKGVWEVASSATTAGTPFYRSLQLVTRQVSSGQTVRLYSPILPTGQAGNHLVRFRLLEPELDQQPPALQYVVTQPLLEPPTSFDMMSPATDSLIDANTVFQWKPVDKASSYRLEIAVRPPANASHDVTAVTGVMVKNKTRASLNTSLMKHLDSGSTYWWHVMAIDESGRIVGETGWRKMRTR